MTTTNLLTEQITLAGLRQQAERLKIPDFAKLLSAGTNQGN
jgi:hypothetical protein